MTPVPEFLARLGQAFSVRERVEWDEESVRRYAGQHLREQVRWDGLVRVEIVTTDGGPWEDDMSWVLTGSNGQTVTVASSIADALLFPLQQLPGFDNEQVIAASGSCENARFLCWEAPAADQHPHDDDAPLRQPTQQHTQVPVPLPPIGHAPDHALRPVRQKHETNEHQQPHGQPGEQAHQVVQHVLEALVSNGDVHRNRGPRP